MAAFKDLPAKDRPDREGNSNNCCDIQFGLDPVHLVCLVNFVCLVRPDEPEKSDEPTTPTKRDQRNKPLHLVPGEMQLI